MNPTERADLEQRLAELEQRRRELVVQSQDDLRVIPERSRMGAFTLVDLDALDTAISRTENETWCNGERGTTFLAPLLSACRSLRCRKGSLQRYKGVPDTFSKVKKVSPGTD